MKTRKIMIAAVVLSGTFALLTTSCKKNEDEAEAPLPPIGGYNSADEVGAADLLAYWPMNGSGNESKTNIAPTTAIGASYEAGAKGQGLKLVAGYLAFPSISALTVTMPAYTISAWAKLKNNSTPTAGSVSVILSLAKPAEWEGNLNFYAETGQRPAVEDNGVVNDSIVVKSGFRTVASGGQAYENLLHLENWMKADNLVTPGKHVARPIATGGVWAHYVATWDGTTNKFIVYINGVKSSNPAFEVRGSNTNIVYDTPVTTYIGAFGTVATTTDSWNKPMTGSVDEIRVYKKALSASDVNSLYELEKAGR